MKAKISVFVICVEVIMYLLLHNLHDGTLISNMPLPSVFAEFASKSNHTAGKKNFTEIFKKTGCYQSLLLSRLVVLIRLEIKF